MGKNSKNKKKPGKVKSPKISQMANMFESGAFEETASEPAPSKAAETTKLDDDAEKTDAKEPTEQGEVHKEELEPTTHAAESLSVRSGHSSAAASQDADSDDDFQDFESVNEQDQIEPEPEHTNVADSQQKVANQTAHVTTGLGLFAAGDSATTAVPTPVIESNESDDEDDFEFAIPAGRAVEEHAQHSSGHSVESPDPSVVKTDDLETKLGTDTVPSIKLDHADSDGASIGKYTQDHKGVSAEPKNEINDSVGTPVKEASEVSANDSAESLSKKSVETSANESVKVSAEKSTEVPTEASADVPADVPADVSADVPAEASAKSSSEASRSQFEAPETAASTPDENLFDFQNDTPSQPEIPAEPPVAAAPETKAPQLTGTTEVNPLAHVGSHNNASTDSGFESISLSKEEEYATPPPLPQRKPHEANSDITIVQKPIRLGRRKAPSDSASENLATESSPSRSPDIIDSSETSSPSESLRKPYIAKRRPPPVTVGSRNSRNSSGSQNSQNMTVPSPGNSLLDENPWRSPSPSSASHPTIGNPFVKSPSNSVPLFSPKFGKPRSVSKNSDAGSGTADAAASPSHTARSPSQSMLSQGFQGIFAGIQSGLSSGMSSPTSTGPMSPTTRQRATQEVKELYQVRGAKPAMLNDTNLPLPVVDRKKFPESVKFDKSMNPIFAVCLCDFNHLRGPEIEYWVDENGSLDINDHEQAQKLSSKWPTLPFQALPDGSHEFEETFSTFNILYDEKNKKSLDNICDTGVYQVSNLVDSEEFEKAMKLNELNNNEKNLLEFNSNVTTLWAISCVRQIATDELIEKQDNFTRTSVQKAVVIIGRQPIFGQLKDKLSIITQSLFLQKSFSDKSLLNVLFENLVTLYKFHDESSSLSVLKEADFYVGLPLQDFVHNFKRNALVIFKALLLSKKILFFGKNIESLCNTQLALISLIPNLISNLNDCGSPYLNFNEFNMKKTLSLKTSDRYSLLKFLGLPFQLFGFGGVFIPYAPLQQLDDITSKNKIKHYIMGTSNDLLLTQKSKYCDLLVNLDDNSVEFINKDLQAMTSLTYYDKKFIDLVYKTVDHFHYDKEDIGETSFQGSSDYIRFSFEDYLFGLVSAVKYEKFLNKLGHKNSFDKNGDRGADKTVINQPMLIENVDLNNIENFNGKFIDEWIQTSSFKIFDKHTDNEIFYIFEPLHYAMSTSFAEQQQEFDKISGKINIMGGLNNFTRSVQNRIAARTSAISGYSLDSNLLNSLNDTQSVKSSNDTIPKTPEKFSKLESGSFSLEDLSILDSINDEIEKNNPMVQKKDKKDEKSGSAAGGWWSSWVKK